MSWSRPITTACQWCSATCNGGLTLTPRSMMSTRSDPSVSPCARLIRRSTRSRKRTSTRSSAPPDPPEMRSIFGLPLGKATKIYIPPSPEAFLHGQDPPRTGLAVRTVCSGHCGMVVARSGELRDHRHARRLRRNLFEQLQPFWRHAVFKPEEPGDVAARPSQAINEAGADGVGEVYEHDRHRPGRLQQDGHGLRAGDQDDLRCERDQFRCRGANAFCIAAAPAVINYHVAPDGPP